MPSSPATVVVGAAVVIGTFELASDAVTVAATVLGGAEAEVVVGRVVVGAAALSEQAASATARAARIPNRGRTLIAGA